VHEVPDERRLERRDLLGEELAGNRFEQVLGPAAGVVERCDRFRW
jgi:hypothetical protein